MAIFAAVFTLVLVTATLVTFNLPESFLSVARVKAADGSSFSAAQLEAHEVLKPVAEKLKLNATWGQRYLGGGELQPVETLQILKSRLEIRPVRGTSLFEIRMWGDTPTEAAEVANAIAESARENLKRAGGAFGLEVVDQARPASRPARPNIPLNLFAAVLSGIVIGAAAASAWSALVRRFAVNTGRAPVSPPLPQ